LVVVCNFTPVVRQNYRVGVPLAGRWLERLNTDAEFYGGSNVGNSGIVESQSVAWHGRPASILLTPPPLATIVLQPAEQEPRRLTCRNCASSPVSRIRWARPGTEAASTLRSSPRTPRRSSSACSIRAASARPIASRCPSTLTRSGTATYR